MQKFNILKSSLLSGKIYICKPFQRTSPGYVIFKPHINGSTQVCSHINSVGEFTMKGGCCSSTTELYAFASEEDALWLEKAITANKTISRPRLKPKKLIFEIF